MAKSRAQRLINAVDRLAVWGSVGLVIFLVFVYFWFGAQDYDPQAEQNWFLFRSLVMNTAANLIPVFVLFSGSYLVLRRIQKIKSEENRNQLSEHISEAVQQELEPTLDAIQSSAIYSNFNAMPWESLIDSADRIDLTVHYFDPWINHQSDALLRFFGRGGEVRLVAPNFENEAIVEHVAKRFPEYTRDQVISKIENTYKKLRGLSEISENDNASVKVYYTDVMVWYCGVRFDDADLVIGPFEHNRQMRVSSPATLTPLDKHPEIGKWFENEFDKLIDCAVTHEGT